MAQQIQPTESFLLPKDQATFTEVTDWGGRAQYTYKVLQNSSTEQLIELQRDDGDYWIWSRYRATADHITPVSRRIVGPGQAMMAALLNLVFFALAGFVQRRWTIHRARQKMS